MRLGHVLTIVKWLDDFERVKVLGVGGTGIVYELRHKLDGRKFAMKEMEIKNAAQMRMALKEAEMLKDVNTCHLWFVFRVL
jgi:serine/threonine protein kinase